MPPRPTPITWRYSCPNLSQCYENIKQLTLVRYYISSKVICLHGELGRVIFDWLPNQPQSPCILLNQNTSKTHKQTPETKHSAAQTRASIKSRAKLVQVALVNAFLCTCAFKRTHSLLPCLHEAHLPVKAFALLQ